MPKIPELLAPARDLDALKAAFDAGADAVYLGLKDFSARKRAKNFTFEELFQAIRLKASHNGKIYVTLNTVVFEREIPELLRALAFAREAGADAAIIQDWAIYRIVKDMDLKIPLHASTQMGTKNDRQAIFLERLGFKRVVLERQLSLAEIASIRSAATRIEIEVFIHGAMCFSLSGCCFFSMLFAGRSGNRGECAQPCRWCFRDESGRDLYPFSMRDLDGISALGDLCGIGIDSLKIEGRMKGADYVFPVVSAYRKALDLIRKNGRLECGDADELRREIFRSTLSRSPGRGLFVMPARAPVLLDASGGSTGIRLGNVEKKLRKSLYFKTSESFSVGDTLRLHDPRTDRRMKLPVKAIYLADGKARVAPAGGYVGVPAGAGFQAPGAEIFLVQRREGYRPARGRLAEFKWEDFAFEAEAGRMLAGYDDLYRCAGTSFPEFIKLDFDPARRIYEAAGRRFVFVPPGLYEAEAPETEQRLVSADAEGCFLSHPCEVELFRGRRLAGSFYLYAANRAALHFFRSLGIDELSAPVDCDAAARREICRFNGAWFEWRNVPLWITRVGMEDGIFSLKTRKNLKVSCRGGWGTRGM